MTGEQIYTKDDIEQAMSLRRSIDYIIGLRRDILSLRHTLMSLDPEQANIAQPFLVRMDVHINDFDDDLYKLRQVLEDRLIQMGDRRAQEGPLTSPNEYSTLEDDDDA